ncbi:MAG: hypothetical protein A4S17_07345 [Proteobacteria bacterium HN_bin10]|nr:MAG: hypothetical protein A4S17_07345 [Proteobacteria bacterium HN_bin10]
MTEDANTAARDGVRRAWIGIGVPVLGLVLVMIMISVATFWGVARDQDRAFEVSSKRLVESAIDGRAHALSDGTLDYANWTEAYQSIVRSWDQEWIEANFYSSVIDGMILFRADGTVRYSWVDEDLGAEGAAMISPVVAAAVDVPDLSRLSRAPTPEGTVARTVLNLDGQLVLVAVAPVTQEDDAVRLARQLFGEQQDFLASFYLLTSAKLSEIGASLDLQALAFVPAAEGAEAAGESVVLPLLSADDRPVGHLQWRHARPGIASFQRQTWPVVIGLLIIGALALTIARMLVARNIGAMAHAEGALESSRLKAEFLARVSYELRTPLNDIIGYAEIIEEENEAPATRADARRIIASARHLNNLLNDILDQSRIHANRMQVRQDVIPVAGFLTEVQGLMRRSASEAGVTLSARSGAVAGYVVADHARLRQCMLNLVGNAIKFAPRGNVTICARSAAIEGRDMVVFDVADDGIGIAKADLDNLFRPFGQANASIGKKFGGNGLGLSISRDLARAMGGDITVTSEPNKGSTFSLSVPVATASALRAA